MELVETDKLARDRYYAGLEMEDEWVRPDSAEIDWDDPINQG